MSGEEGDGGAQGVLVGCSVSGGGQKGAKGVRAG